MAKTPESLTDYLKLSDKEKLELMQPESSTPSADLLGELDALVEGLQAEFTPNLSTEQCGRISYRIKGVCDAVSIVERFLANAKVRV